MNAPDLLASEPAPAGVPSQFYRLIAETIAHMVWSSRPDGSDDYFNKRFFEYTGMSAEELACEGWRLVVHPEDWPNYLARWEGALASGERYEIEYRLRRADGEYRWHLGAALPLRNAEGRIVKWFGTCTDIEDQKRASRMLENARADLETTVEERTRALRDSEARFQAFMDNMPAVGWIKDSRLRYAWINRHYRLVHGRPAEELFGRDDFELWPANLAREFRIRDEEALRVNGLVQFLDSVPAPDGKEKHWLVAKFPLPDATGAPGVAGIRFDITERYQLEQALRQNEARMNLTMEAAHLGHWSWDAATDQMTLSEGIYRIHALSPDKPMASPAQWRDLVHPEDRDGFVAAVRETVKHGAPLHHEYRVLRPDGETRWMLLRGRAEAGPDGRTARTFGIAMDVTERAEAQRVQQKYAALSRELVGRLVQTQEDERRRIAGELHDLIGQKLTALGIGLEIVLNELAPDSASRVAPRMSQMAALLEETITAIRGVMADLRPPVLDDHGLVSALHWYASVFEARTGLRVRVAGPERGVRLRHDIEISLFRIAQEAFTNAAKHSGASLVQVLVEQEPGRIELRVEDNGTGFREPRGARAARRGGWGLPEMRERAEAIGGQLSVETAGPGARVIVQVPLANADHGHPG